MGSQRRTFSNVKDMIAKLDGGAIGRVYFARGWYVNNRKSIGKGKVAAVPQNLNFDLCKVPHLVVSIKIIWSIIIGIGFGIGEQARH